MKILINGLCESAGKTTTTIGLYHNFSKLGDVALFKPFAANNYWYDHPIISKTIEKGKIYGRDTELLSGLIDLSPREINPIHRLWAPSSIVGIGLDLRGKKKSLVLDRVWESKGGMTVIKNSEVDFPENLESLSSSAENFLNFSSIEELNNYMEELHLEAVEKSYENVNDCDFLLTESYSDVAKPVTLEFDAVVTVEPGKAYLTDGKEFGKAYRTISKRWKEYGREIRTRKILEVLKPKTFEISPISTKQNVEKNYLDLFEGLKEKAEL